VYINASGTLPLARDYKIIRYNAVRSNLRRLMWGSILQISTIAISLLTGLLLSRPRWRRYGYLLGFSSLPLWVIQELYYGQMIYVWLNPIYAVIWGVGLANHWNEKI